VNTVPAANDLTDTDKQNRTGKYTSGTSVRGVIGLTVIEQHHFIKTEMH